MALTRSTYVQGAGQKYQDSLINPSTLAAGTLFQRFDIQAFPQKGVKFSYAGVAAVTAVDEVQTATEGGSGLTSFTLTYAGQTTASIAAGASAAAVQAALIALSNLAPGDVVVTGTGPYAITFGGTLAGTDVAQITSTPTGGTGTMVMATSVAGVAAVPAVPAVPLPARTTHGAGS